MKIREYQLKSGVTKIYAPIEKILSVQAKGHEIFLWAETGKRDKNSLFLFVTLDNDQNLKELPYFEFAKYLNTVFINGKPKHIYFYHQPGKKYLDREIDEYNEAFFEAISHGIPGNIKKENQ